MKANKIFFDLYSTSGGRVPYDEYRKWYEKNDIVYIVLVDSKIYTKVKRQTMFDMGLWGGCFIEDLAFDTPEEVRASALNIVREIGATYVEPQDFKRIEKQNEQERVSKAFAMAESMIARG